MTTNQQPTLAERIGRIVEAARQSLPNAQISVSISITIKDETNTTRYAIPPAHTPPPEASPGAQQNAAPPPPASAQKPATPQQVKAIRDVGTRAFGVSEAQLAERIREQYGCDPEQLTAAQASELYTNLTETAHKATATKR